MRSEGIRGIHVFWGIAGFFAVMVAVQTFFVVQAVRTFPGEEVKESYMQGIDYNRTLARRDKQRRMGWTAQAGLEQDSTLVVRIDDASSQPLPGLSVMALVRHPGGEEKEFTLVERRPGEYVVQTSATRGRLRLVIEARRNEQDEPVFEAVKVLEVK